MAQILENIKKKNLSEIEKKCIQASVINGTIDFGLLDTQRKGFAVGIFLAAINEGIINEDMFSDQQIRDVNDVLETLANANKK